MERSNKSSKKRHIKMSTHHTGEMTQVTTSLKTNTKLAKKTPPSKITAHKK